MAGNEGNATRQRNVPCPFCGLLCDDLEVELTGEGIEVRSGGCYRGAEGFRKAAEASARFRTPTIAGEAASLDQAVGEAARLLDGSRFPLVAGLGAEGNGIRAAIQLADRLGGAIDHLHAGSLLSHVRALQDNGGITTTLSELHNRADLVVLLGTPLLDQAPRFYERFVRPREGLFPERLARRQVVAVGQPEDPAGRWAIDETLNCPPEGMGEVVAALRARVNGHPLQAREVAGIDCEHLARLGNRLRQADYAVVAWNAEAPSPGHGDLVVDTIHSLIRDLNHTTRCAGIPLGGGAGATTALQATTWQTGFPLRLRFRGGQPEFTPRKGAAEGMLARGEPDALVWISAFSEEAAPPATDVPTVALARGSMPFEKPPAVAIPVGTPGVDHGGPLFRCDGSVSLPLRALLPGRVPSVGEVLGRIGARLAAGEG